MRLSLTGSFYVASFARLFDGGASGLRIGGSGRFCLGNSGRFQMNGLWRPQAQLIWGVVTIQGVF